MVERWYHELENKYPRIRCREYIIMPNHMHFIIEITDHPTIDDTDGMVAHVADAQPTDAHVGASLRGRPIDANGRPFSGHSPGPVGRGHTKP